MGREELRKRRSKGQDRKGRLKRGEEEDPRTPGLAHRESHKDRGNDALFLHAMKRSLRGNHYIHPLVSTCSS